jgi:hypothetical protein
MSYSTEIIVFNSGLDINLRKIMVSLTSGSLSKIYNELTIKDKFIFLAQLVHY